MVFIALLMVLGGFFLIGRDILEGSTRGRTKRPILRA